MQSVCPIMFQQLKLLSHRKCALFWFLIIHLETESCQNNPDILWLERNVLLYTVQQLVTNWMLD